MPTVFTRVSRALITAHQHLLLFNLKRAPVLEQSAIYRESNVYNLLDQARFMDTHDTVVEVEHGPAREG